MPSPAVPLSCCPPVLLCVPPAPVPAQCRGLLPSSAGCTPQSWVLGGLVPPGDCSSTSPEGNMRNHLLTALLVIFWKLLTSPQAWRARWVEIPTGGTKQQRVWPSRGLDLEARRTNHNYFCCFHPTVPALERRLASTSNPSHVIHTLKGHRSSPTPEEVFHQTLKCCNLPWNDARTSLLAGLTGAGSLLLLKKATSHPSESLGALKPSCRNKPSPSPSRAEIHLLPAAQTRASVQV